MTIPAPDHDRNTITFDDGRYLDWSVQLPGGGWELELGDHEQSAVIEVSTAELAFICGALSATLAQQPEATITDDDRNGLAFSYGRYLDWSLRLPDGGWRLELGDYEVSAVIAVSTAELAAIRDALSHTVIVVGDPIDLEEHK